MTKKTETPILYFAVRYFAEHTPSGIIHGFTVLDTPPDLFRVLPLKEKRLSRADDSARQTEFKKHIEFNYKRRKFFLTFYMKAGEQWTN